MINLIVHFSTLDDYSGEFGFDGVMAVMNRKDGSRTHLLQGSPLTKLEYIYDTVRNQYVHVMGNPELQQQILQEYRPLKMPLFQDDYVYYTPYLNIFPNQEVELQMEFTLYNRGINILDEIITFEKNDAYLVTVDGKTNENIKYTPNGRPKEISIKCLKPSEETHIIAKDGRNNIIGKLCIKDNRANYDLEVRMICVVQDTPKKDTEIENLIEEFKINKIDDYLNKRSLNQALIKTKVEIDKKYHLALSEEKIESIFNAVDIKENPSEHNNMMFDRLVDEYRNHFENGGEKFKGVIMFLNRLSLPSINKSGVTGDEPNTKDIIIFEQGLNDKSTYAHEIAHTLELEHSFIEQYHVMFSIERGEELQSMNEYVDEKIQLIESENEKIAKNEQNIIECQNEITKLKLNDNQNEPEVASRIENLEQQIKNSERDNSKCERSIERAAKKRRGAEREIMKTNKYIEKFRKNRYGFAPRTTINLMDYSKARRLFTHWQWDIMQNSIKNSSQHAH